MKKRTMIFTAAALGGAAIIATRCAEDSLPPPPKYAYTASEDLFVYDLQGRNGNMLGVLKGGECVITDRPANRSAAMGAWITAQLNAPDGPLKVRLAEGRLKHAPDIESTADCKAGFYQTFAVPGAANPGRLATAHYYKAAKPVQLYSAPGRPIPGQFAEAGSCLIIDLAAKPEKDYFAITAAGYDVVKGYAYKKDIAANPSQDTPCWAELRIDAGRPAPAPATP